MPSGTPCSPHIVDITSSYCFRADRTKNGARVLNSVLPENKNGTPLPHIMPALGCEILGVNPSRGHVGFKRAISDSMRKKGGKWVKKDASLTGSSQKIMRRGALGLTARAPSLWPPQFPLQLEARWAAGQMRYQSPLRFLLRFIVNGKSFKTTI